LSVALALPWFLWMYYALGWQFIHQYALAGNIYYITQPESFSNRGFNHTLYLGTFLAGFFPWSIVTLGGAVDALRRWRADLKVSTEEILLWAWVGVVFLLFSVARFKVDRYVYPAAPACCLLAARAWLSVNVWKADSASARDNVAARWSVAVLGVLLIVIGMYGGASLFGLGLELPRTALLIPVSLAAAGAALTVGIVMRGGVSPLLLTGIVTMLLVAYGSVIVIGVPILERARPTAAVAEALRPQLTADARVGLYRLEKWRFSLRYYLQRPVTRLQTPEDVQAFLEVGTPAYLLMLDEDFTRLRDRGIDLRCISERPAVTGTSGRGLRKQRWGAIIVASAGDP
jgi:4-amino-4-deoxy-L-arabinose transferase-like glycosyltransferase